MTAQSSCRELGTPGRTRGRLASVLHYTGRITELTGWVTLVPLAVVAMCWGDRGDGPRTLVAFLGAALCGIAVGRFVRWRAPAQQLDMVGSMLVCGLSWLVASAVGALPFVWALDASFLDGYFEAISGFTTTGITVFQGLDAMPRSILFWRAWTHWLGGLGILSLFLALSFQGRSTHLMHRAESHKIATARPAPGLVHTIRVLWAIYILLALGTVLLLVLLRMSPFDAVCHAFAALSTGGFSPYDASIAHYAATNHANHRSIEYTLTLAMLLGGTNFLVLYRLLRLDLRALFDGLEVRWWWALIGGLTLLVTAECLMDGGAGDAADVERVFRAALFQVVAIITTTGFATHDIASSYFGAAAQQLFLVAMVIGGCVGSTGGGIKVLRVAVLWRLMLLQLYRVRVSPRASAGVVVDGKLFPDVEVERVSALFFGWMALLVLGGVITALFTDLSAMACFSGMFSALGNIGPSHITVPQMVGIHPVAKITFIFGMVAGRLELLPVLLLFSRKAWR